MASSKDAERLRDARRPPKKDASEVYPGGARSVAAGALNGRTESPETHGGSHDATTPKRKISRPSIRRRSIADAACAPTVAFELLKDLRIVHRRGMSVPFEFARSHFQRG